MYALKACATCGDSPAFQRLRDNTSTRESPKRTPPHTFLTRAFLLILEPSRGAASPAPASVLEGVCLRLLPAPPDSICMAAGAGDVDCELARSADCWLRDNGEAGAGASTGSAGVFCGKRGES